MRRALPLILALLASAAILLLGIVSFHRGTARSRPVVPPFELFACTSDDECVLVSKVGCCGCTEGGAQAAVTRWRRDDLRRFLKTACQPSQVCVQVDLCRNDLKAICVNRRCVVDVVHD